MRTCDKCGKVNQPTRKFCIRCGASLIKVEKAKPAPAQPSAPVESSKSQGKLTPAPPITTDDKWVKPSEVSKDRVRVAGHSKGKTELEKAREAFAKAETVGIDEADGSGIIETRMLRASEVRELLEGPGMMQVDEVPTPTMMEGSEPLPPEATEMMAPSMPSSSQIEESILGSKSGFVSKPKKPEPEVMDTGHVSSQISAEFSSSRYEQDEGASEFEGDAEVAPSPRPTSKPSAPQVGSERKISEDAIDLVITCPDCGKTINVDMFEYPSEVYSAMAAARMKQARFFIVQGKGEDALRIVRMANALYTKANDKIGLQEIRKLIETLAKG
ncbi:MAG: zinc ribbon domain-containing protein [Candidatus Thorarchaeota archaeon]|nr:zinc ribbon domain-containing protein [Candidatus Thorarchaeota archaeon]